MNSPHENYDNEEEETFIESKPSIRVSTAVAAAKPLYVTLTGLSRCQSNRELGERYINHVEAIIDVLQQACVKDDYARLVKMVDEYRRLLDAVMNDVVREALNQADDLQNIYTQHMLAGNEERQCQKR